MNNKNYNEFQIILGIFILVFFGYVSIINIIPNSSSNSYYTTDEDNINARITNIEITDNKLMIKTSGNAAKGCIKTTLSTPKEKDFCWININNNTFSTSIYKNKKYYIWLMDENGKIGNIHEAK